MNTLLELSEMEFADTEMTPEILPVDARLSIHGSVSSLIELFERAVAVAPVKEIIRGTSFILLEAFESTANELSYVQITATDGEQSIAVLNDTLTVNMAGAALLPGKRVLDILKLAPSDAVRLDVLGNTATIHSERAVWTVQTPIGDSLPPFPDVNGITLHQVDRKALLEALEVARKAVATTTARTSLMQAEIKNGAITACDSARVHRKVIEGFPTSLNFTLPVRTMDEAIRALKASDSEFIELGCSISTFVMRLGQDILIGQRLVVPFPDVEQLLMAPAMMNTAELTVNTQELSAIVRRVRINADTDFSAIFLAILPTKTDTKWTLAVRARDRSGNTSQETMDVLFTGGTKAREICVNHRYLFDLLSCYEEEFGVIKLGEDTKTKKSPILIEDSVTGFTAVLAQMAPNLLR